MGRSLGDQHPIERVVVKKPRDDEVITELPRYKGLAPEYHDWSTIRERALALSLALGGAW
jgi:hypothetical protein